MSEIIKDNKEIIDGNKVTVKLDIPDGLKVKDIKLKHDKNTYSLSYSTVETNETDGMKSYKESSGWFSRTYPFEIKDPKAVFEDGKLIVTFKKGLEKGNNKEIPIEYKTEGK
ncbi:hypothetical protein DMUE_0246 [Dictyocoela muelleri]|nr:hypothetical protein DMUE_0246 [Dictyocoela muelleri]